MLISREQAGWPLFSLVWSTVFNSSILNERWSREDSCVSGSCSHMASPLHVRVLTAFVGVTVSGFPGPVFLICDFHGTFPMHTDMFPDFLNLLYIIYCSWWNPQNVCNLTLKNLNLTSLSCSFLYVMMLLTCCQSALIVSACSSICFFLIPLTFKTIFVQFQLFWDMLLPSN